MPPRKLDGPEWRRLRAIVAATLPRPCERCGQAIEPGSLWELDHRTPRVLGGAWYDLANLRPLHRPCNRHDGWRLARVGAARRRTAAPTRAW